MLWRFGRETLAARTYQESSFDGFAFGQGSAASFALTSAMHAPVAGKLTEAFPVDGVGDIKPVLPSGLLVVTPDEAGNGKGVAPGNPTITVGAPSFIGTINTNGDEDYFQINLVAGQTYEIGMYGKSGGPSTVPLADCYIELYGSNGTTLIVSADGGADTPANAVNSGFDVLLVFEAETTGTYYINARAFDNDPTDGTTGEGVGDYELFARVQDPNDPNVYHPYYDVDSPLYAIDWGTQVNKVHQSVRNPDGDEGPRDTGNPQGNLNYSDATSLEALAAAQGKDITGKNVITVYFAHAGEVYVDDDPTTAGATETIVAKGFADWEIAAYQYAFAAYEKVADVVYLVIDSGYSALTQDNPSADFTFVTYEGTPGPGVSLLGRMSPPDEDNEGQSEFNAADERWTQDGLAPGGFSFTTLIHEMGHGHGLAHPHDNGGHSGIMRGVEPEGVAFDYTNGDYDLNQSVYTMMSYEDGWQKSPYGQADTTDPFGWLKGLMAFDIAVIQDKYGVNEDTATGNNVYILEDANHGTTFDANNNITQFASGFESIWDAGGLDEIKYVGNRNASIDLRAASLQYEYGGGGWISYVDDIYGGYTIANGVVIENATGGNGNDTLHDNIGVNRLDGGNGNDTLWVDTGGADVALGGDGNDAFLYGHALTNGDVVNGGAGTDQLGLQGDYTGTSRLTFGFVTNIEQIILLAGDDTRFGDSGTHSYSYDLTSHNVNVAAGQLLQIDANKLRAGENFTFNGAAETDGKFLIWAGKGVDLLTGGSGDDGFLFRGNGTWGTGDRVNGGGGNDQVGIRGDYDGANSIVMGASQLVNVETLIFMSGADTRFGPAIADADYNVTMNNGNVASGQQMLVDAASLRSGETFVFNGAAETDGSYRIVGGQYGDVITGSANGDNIRGALGKDTLTGGGGGDTFAYAYAGDSSGPGYDTLTDLNSAQGDKLDLHSVVSGWAASVNSGQLNAASFNADLAAAVNAPLGANQAILFTASSGDQAGKTFLVVDGNGDGAYSQGQDYVFLLGPSAAIDTSSTALFV